MISNGNFRMSTTTLCFSIPIICLAIALKADFNVLGLVIVGIFSLIMSYLVHYVLYQVKNPLGVTFETYMGWERIVQLTAITGASIGAMLFSISIETQSDRLMFWSMPIFIFSTFFWLLRPTRYKWRDQ